jgi:hypothetical protein
VLASNSSILRERRLLQVAVALLALIPIGAGLSGVWLGRAMLHMTGADVTADSHFRYLSGLLLAIGLCFWRLVPIIERAEPAARLLTFLVFVGGLGRLVSLIALGLPSPAMLGGLGMELVVAPLLCLWQMRIARNYR